MCFSGTDFIKVTFGSPEWTEVRHKLAQRLTFLLASTTPSSSSQYVLSQGPAESNNDRVSVREGERERDIYIYIDIERYMN